MTELLFDPPAMDATATQMRDYAGECEALGARLPVEADASSMPPASAEYVQSTVEDVSTVLRQLAVDLTSEADELASSSQMAQFGDSTSLDLVGLLGGLEAALASLIGTATAPDGALVADFAPSVGCVGCLCGYPAVASGPVATSSAWGGGVTDTGEGSLTSMSTGASGGSVTIGGTGVDGTYTTIAGEPVVLTIGSTVDMDFTVQTPDLDALSQAMGVGGPPGIDPNSYVAQGGLINATGLNLMDAFTLPDGAWTPNLFETHDSLTGKTYSYDWGSGSSVWEVESGI